MVLKLMSKHKPVSCDPSGGASESSALPRSLQICAMTLISCGENKANWSLTFFCLKESFNVPEKNKACTFILLLRCHLNFKCSRRNGRGFVVYLCTYMWLFAYIYIWGCNSLTPALHHCLSVVNLCHSWITLLWIQLKLGLQRGSKMLFSNGISESFMSGCGFAQGRGPRRS